ncbi:exodeoxyribonuclease III [Pseudosulfitobacter pseudonitzschiae]|uniref:exodeoxyribonuclease III n=1 Tax=Pseudosulfitobacter pseudonitzschiae TaxID=1402135 RepID=UPI001AF1DD57|nr:exodeoxyribonuclease III [Pseudosulfitobacter pseudonitzschiae]MBM1814600.1 exodeoxyribonuclease III [Pseudosulfitobacter pseudonitzschiae]MBM1831594.1 exodeoxyribonuclease III [Pseudosulfitobacter pseudonitzschiae]MBM1836459.1 exodeoxyribonuclease III [Pseudosulfitobacter pseudonitzschiae]MBM1841306.1 exodeoxyribonuclease III [Pseudosulfitobacter pseudonitzschiae]MBM1846173.1 exodeoxyribonuclease III [Pseudosulfitobacter pseudonitzschiae]
MKIATFNINGIKARAQALPDWLDTFQPDVVLLQEIKSVDEGFPRELFEERGYNVEVHGQKSFNGVGILSKLPLEEVTRGLPGDDDDEQARWIEATVVGDHEAVRLCGLYLPNGNPVPGPKYDYKLAWMARMQARAEALLAEEMPFLMAGDYNIIPQAEDAARPEAWREDALFRLESRAAYRRILNLGLTEAFRTRDPRPGQYSFWDYQAGAWNRNDGIRIDHFLLSPAVADMMTDAGIERDVRGLDKPSDHVPVWVELAA